MDSRQIYSILANDSHVIQTNFLGVFASNLIPLSSLKYPCSLIVNTKPITHTGEHWITIIKDENNKGYYFDSFGMSPANFPEASEVLEFCKSWDFNDMQLQSLLTTVCGQYCTFFLLHIARGFTPDQIITAINDSGDTAANDAFVFNYVRDRYGSMNDIDEVKIVDYPFLKNQLASIP